MENLEPRTQNQPYSYRNLLLWQQAQDLALAVVKLAAALPRDNAAQVIARQIISSAASVSANIAEGHGRFTLAAHRKHLSIAKGSACETDGWLDLLPAGYAEASLEGTLHDQCEEVIRMLTAKIVQLDRMERTVKAPGVRENVAIYQTDEYADGSRF
jgi:four helix bundle protein